MSDRYVRDSDGNMIYENVTDSDDPQPTRVTWPVERDNVPHDPTTDLFGWL